MELDEALNQISVIRRQLARAEVFRGYRAVPVAVSGLLAFAAAAVQSVWISNPREQMDGYLTLWLGAATLSACGAGYVMVRRATRLPSALARQATWNAIEQLLPSLVVGALLTFILLRRAPNSVVLLPGLWQLFFSLGIFASYRLLPRATFWVGVYYLITGLGCLAWFPGDSALEPWVMGFSFGVGQSLAAGILYWTLERTHDESEFQG